MTVISSGTHYLPGRLAAQAEAVLAQHPGGRAPASIAGPGVTIAGCVRQVTGGASPALVDEARYNGQQATVIMQAPAGGQPGQVWVAGPGCHLLAHVLLPAAG
jgi:hypothetical protein